MLFSHCIGPGTNALKAAGGKSQKDMAAYKFWQTQPVPRFGKIARTAAIRERLISSQMISLKVMRDLLRRLIPSWCLRNLRLS